MSQGYGRKSYSSYRSKYDDSKKYSQDDMGFTDIVDLDRTTRAYPKKDYKSDWKSDYKKNDYKSSSYKSDFKKPSYRSGDYSSYTAKSSYDRSDKDRSYKSGKRKSNYTRSDKYESKYMDPGYSPRINRLSSKKVNDKEYRSRSKRTDLPDKDSSGDEYGEDNPRLHRGQSGIRPRIYQDSAKHLDRDNSANDDVNGAETISSSRYQRADDGYESKRNKNSKINQKQQQKKKQSSLTQPLL